MDTSTAFRLLIASMLLLSTYFTVDVEIRRRALFGSTYALTIAPGDSVEIRRPLDGDELGVSHDGHVFTVRLLGVKAFDVTNEPDLGDPGQRAIDQLGRLTGQVATVHYDSQTVDPSGRLIARLEIDGKDVGAELLASGWAMLYDKYPFAEAGRYGAIEAEARREHRGIWGIPKARQRAEKLQRGWREE